MESGDSQSRSIYMCQVLKKKHIYRTVVVGAAATGSMSPALSPWYDRTDLEALTIPA